MGGTGGAEGYGGGDGDGIPEQTNGETVLDDAARKEALEDELKEYGITLSGTWSLNELEMLWATVHATANRLQSFAADEYARNGLPFDYTPQQVFRRIFGDLTFVRGEGADSNGDEEGGRWGQYDRQRITLWGKAFTNRLRTFSERSVEESMAFLTMHELGHDLNREMVLVKRGEDLFERLTTRNYYKETSAKLFNSDPGTAGYTYRARTNNPDMWLEYQADAVANWLDSTFDDTDAGRTRQAQMDGIMRALIFNKFGHPEQLVNRQGCSGVSTVYTLRVMLVGIVFCVLGVLAMLQPIQAQNSLFEEVLRLPLEGLCQIALSPNGAQIAVKRFIDTEKQRMELAIYGTQRGERQALLYNGRGKCSPEYGAQNTLAWEGQTLAVVFEEGVMAWEANDRFEQRYAVEGSLFALSTVADRLVTVSFEKRFAAGNVLEPFPVLILRDLDSGRELGRHTVRQLNEDDFFTVNLLAWNPRGQALLVSDGYAVRAVDVDGEAIAPREPTWGAGHGLGLLSWLDDRSVVTGEGTGIVRVWEVADGTQQRELYLKSCGLALSPDQRWLAGFEVNDSPDFSDGIPLEPAVNIFDLLEVKLLAKLPYKMQDKQSNPCLQIAFSADSQYLAAIADEDNPTLYVWARRE